jgi:hypothetical protein
MKKDKLIIIVPVLSFSILLAIMLLVDTIFIKML